jgi:probable F420-dependent oxidoreductase
MLRRVRFTLQLPTDRVDAADEFVSGAAVAEMARTAEQAGFDACFVTEHPFPPDRWLEGGGHHALDPWVALSFAAAATTRICVQTHIAVLAYRNPFLTAKALASLDVLSGGRVILGVAAGYLRGEFEALGVPFDERNELTDEALDAIRRALTESGVVQTGRHFSVVGNSMLPRPIQQPHPPIWVGGNSRQAIRRAVERGDGWIPFATAGLSSKRIRTAAIESIEELEQRIGYAREHARSIGRSAPLDICFSPLGISLERSSDVTPERFAAHAQQLAKLGVTWMAFGLRAATRAAWCERVREIGATLLPAARSV